MIEIGIDRMKKTQYPLIRTQSNTIRPPLATNTVRITNEIVKYNAQTERAQLEVRCDDKHIVTTRRPIVKLVWNYSCGSGTH